MMKLHKTYKYKLKLTKNQEKVFDSYINTCRYVFNVALEGRVLAYKMRKKSVSRFDQYKELTEAKKEFSFISEVHSDVLQETLDRVDKSYKNFFIGSGFPNFAKKGQYNSFTFKRKFEVTNNHIKLPKIGSVKYYNSRSIEGLPKIATIVKENKGYFINIVCEIEAPDVVINDYNAVGIDVGIAKFAYLSNNTAIETPLFLQPNLDKLRLLQRKLHRQVKGSVSRDKTKQKISNLHRKITNSRLDFLHKESTKISNEFSSCYIEDLKLLNMVKLNSTLSRKMLDSGFGTFKELLSYKFKERGKHLGLVNPAYTSQTCSECLSVDKKSRLSQSEYVCTSCGHVENADFNASKNILRKGISQSTKAQTLV